MVEKFRNFYIDHASLQQNTHADALASLAASLALLAGTKEKVLVYSHDLYCSKLALEDNQTPTGDLQVKKSSRDFKKIRAQGLAIPIHRLCLIRHIARLP